MLTEIPEVKLIHDTRSHNSGNIHDENLHIGAVEREKSFLENRNIFSQKKLHHNYQETLGYKM